MDWETLKSVLPDPEPLKKLIPDPEKLPKAGDLGKSADAVIRRVWTAELGSEMKRAGYRNILEVCCGDGEATLPVAHMADTSEIVAVDSDPETVQKAKKRLLTSSCENIRYECADAASLPYAEGMFDCAFVAFSLNTVANPGEIIAEMSRVVREGGAVYCLEDIVREERPDQPVRSSIAKALQINEIATLTTDRKRRLKKTDLCRMMLASGLQHVGTFSHAAGAAVCCRGKK